MLYRSRELVRDRRRGRGGLVMLKRVWGKIASGPGSGEAVVKAD